MPDMLLIPLAFFCGSLPFSVWIGKLALGKDIRSYGDHNPGATNVFRAGGKVWGIIAVLLDMLKAAIPVGYAWFIAKPSFWTMTAIALATGLGHVFSPFLGFRGGKAVGPSAGIWIGLTMYEIPTVGGLLLFYWAKSVIVSGWAVIFTYLSVLLYLLLARPDPLLLTIWAGNMAIMVWTHRAELQQAPGVKPWVKNLVSRWKS